MFDTNSSIISMGLRIILEFVKNLK